MTRPILLLDVDGVINCFGTIWTEEYEAEHFDGGCARMSDEGHFSLRVRHETGVLLRELAEVFDVVWCTAWEERAHPQFQQWLGLPEEPWPHISFQDWNGRLANGRSWKAPWVDEWATDRGPIAWLDDDLGLEDARWASLRSEHHAPTMLERTRPAQGLVRHHVDRLKDFAGTVSGAARA
jgi:hypothetical protein